MKHAIVSLTIGLLLAVIAVEATTIPHCFFAATNHVFFPGDVYIHFKQNGLCESHITCKLDYNLDIKECADYSCPLKDGGTHGLFPDCCCDPINN